MDAHVHVIHNLKVPAVFVACLRTLQRDRTGAGPRRSFGGYQLGGCVSPDKQAKLGFTTAVAVLLDAFKWWCVLREAMSDSSYTDVSFTRGTALHCKEMLIDQLVDIVCVNS